ncbi:unnamed protein product [Anisakis simplex]|uniref:Uncharacterized protein n=1 Tax=Anisakis simplex TaxID=6269 RepID=A0A3P6SB29_ANISI|nr:unnamed protein product [Anisakis simplex]
MHFTHPSYSFYPSRPRKVVAKRFTHFKAYRQYLVMVRAWLMCSPVINQSAPCSRDPSVDLSTAKLHQLGILTQYVPVVDKNGLLDKICKERGYTIRDKLVVSRDVTPDYDTEVCKRP